jgi:PHD/YefM family antitoxin component YafN of YafNO toxin-antitoxin module
MSIHPQIIEKEGKKEFVVLPYEEFLQIQEALEDLDDIRILREERITAASDPAKSLDDVLAEISE